jgi:hypothetical protein
MFRAFLLLLLVSVVAAMPAISCVANVRGKKYDISAETVGEFSQKVEGVSGLVAGEQSVLFRGKVLNPSDKLEDLGIAPGDVLNVLKGRKAKAPKAQLPKEMDSYSSLAPKTPESAAGMTGMSPEDMMKNMDPEKIKQSMQAMERLLDSDVIEQYFGDDEKIEQARLQMLASADEYEKMMPGFKEQAKEVASDPEKWRNAMNAAKQQILQLKQLRDAQKAASSLPEYVAYRVT